MNEMQFYLNSSKNQKLLIHMIIVQETQNVPQLKIAIINITLRISNLISKYIYQTVSRPVSAEFFDRNIVI